MPTATRPSATTACGTPLAFLQTSQLPVRLVPVPPRLRSATKLDLIARVPLFAALSKSERGQVASIADEIDLPGDKLLIREGEPGREFFVLLEGEVEVTRKG